MILRTLCVEGWRCFANPLEIGPLAEGLNVIYGPNGSGKSTLMQALISGFFDNHRVSGDKVEALRPWGRDLAPQLTIEFEHHSERLRLNKRLLDTPSAQLSRWEDGKFVRLAEGEAADARLREMLAAEAPTRGLSKMPQWGFAQVLWAPQRGLQLDKLSTGMTQAIQSALGAQVVGAGASAIEKRIEQLYTQTYTSQGKLISGAKAPPVVGMQADMAEAQKQRRDLQAKLEAFDEAARRIEDLKSRQTQAERNAEQQERDLAAARRCAQQYSDVRATRDQQAAEARTAEARYGELKQRIEALAAARRELTEAEAAVARLHEDAPLVEKHLTQCQAEADRASQALSETRGRRGEIDAAEQLAQQAARWTEAQREAASAAAQIERVDAVEKEIAAFDVQRSALVAPDAKTLAAIRTATTKRQTAQVKLDAALIAVEIRAESAVAVEGMVCEAAEHKQLAAGETCRLKGAPEVVFRLPGVAVIRATGPTGSADELRGEVSKAEAAIEKLSAGFGTRDLDALERLHQDARELDAELDKRRERLSALLAGRRLDELRQQQARWSQAVAELAARQPAWQETPPDAKALAEAAERTKAAFIATVERVEGEKDKAQSALSAAAQQQAVLGGKLKAAVQTCEAARQRLARLAPADEDDAARNAQSQRLLLEWDAAKAKLADAEAKLRDFATDPGKDVEVLEERLRAIRHETTTLAAELNRAQGRLETLAAEAPYSALAEVEERIERLQGEIARQTVRNEAIRLLRNTLAACKQRAVEAVVGPVEQRATETLQRIAGPRLGNLRFSDSFAPQHVAPATADGQTVLIDELAGGEQEQVHFAVRLALADVLFDGQRQPIVFDDALTYTDAARMARVLRILDEAAVRFQILIFTCHPERYRGLPKATFWDLEALTNGSV